MEAPLGGLGGDPRCSVCARRGGASTSVGTHQPAGLVMTFTLPGKHANHVPGPEITRPLDLRKLISPVGHVCLLLGQVRLQELPPQFPKRSHSPRRLGAEQRKAQRRVCMGSLEQPVPIDRTSELPNPASPAGVHWLAGIPVGQDSRPQPPSQPGLLPGVCSSITPFSASTHLGSSTWRAGADSHKQAGLDRPHISASPTSRTPSAAPLQPADPLPSPVRPATLPIGLL